MSFKRPESLNFPIVYREFSSIKGDSIKFRIQDLPEEYFEEAVELLLKHFMPEETFCVAKKLYDDDEIRNIMIEFYQEILRKKLSIGCFAEGSRDLIAVNIMDVKSKGDEEPEVNKNDKEKLFYQTIIFSSPTKLCVKSWKWFISPSPTSTLSKLLM